MTEKVRTMLSVGGFRGMGTHLVADPFANFQISSKRVMCYRARRRISSLPEFKYAPD
jgi:hypothetical protein